MGSKDERIVEMTFDNKQFEQGIAQSRQSLKDLEKSLQLEQGANGFANISKAAENVDLSAIARGVEALQERFSFFGIMGMKVMEEIATAAINLGKNLWNMTFGQIKSGGIRRAMNVENAHFMLQGLLKDEEKVQEIMGWAMDSVDGTAYAFDSAAKAASQFAASGVTAEEDMTKALKAITGVAAMTNSEYDDISRIFTTVAGNGRLMGDQLLQLSGRGMNAASTLMEFFNGVNDGSKKASEGVTEYVKSLTKGLNVTESDIRDFVSKGKINFDVFSEAMNEAFGEHAKKANETLTGVMANVKAALSKIGADFVQDLIVQNGPLVKFFNALRESINRVRKELGPFSSTFVSAVTTMADKATNFFKYIKVEYIIQAMAHGLEMIKQILKPIGEAFRDVFGETTIFRMNVALNNFKNFIQSLKVSDRAVKNIHDIFGGFFAVLSIGSQIFKALINNITPLGDLFMKLGGNVADAGGSIGQFLMNLSTSLKETDFFNRIFGNVKDTIINVVDKIKEKLSRFSGVKNLISDVFSGIKNAFSTDVSGDNMGKAAEIVDKLSEAFKKLLDILKQFGGVVKEAFSNFTSGIDKTSVTTTVISGLTAVFEIFAGVLKIVVDALIQVGKSIGEIAKNGLANFSFDSFVQLLEGGAAVTLLAKLGEILGKFARSIDANTLLSIGKALLMLVGSIALLTLLDQVKVNDAIGTITTLLTELVVAYNAMTGLFNKAGRNATNQGIGGFIGKMTGLSNALSGLSSMFYEARNVLRAQVLITLAGAVLILTAALAVLAKIPKEKLQNAMTAITVLIGELIISFKLLSKSFNSAEMSKMGGTLIGFGVAILLLSVSLERLSKLKPEALKQGLLGLAGIMLELGIFMRMINKTSFNASTGVGLIAMAAAMEIFYDVVKKFGNLDGEVIAKGIVALGGALMVIAIALRMMPGTSNFTKTTDSLSSNNTNFIKIGAALILMGAAMEIFADVIAKLGELPLENIAKGLVGIGGALLACTLSLNFIDSKGVMSKATALVVLGVAMEIFADVIQKIGSMNLENIAKGLGAIIISLGAAVIALNALSQGDSIFSGNGFFAATSQGSLIKSATALIIVAAALEIFADVLQKVGSMSLEEIAKGLIAVGGGIAIMVAGLKVLNGGGMKSAAAILTVSIALTALARVIKTLGTLPVSTTIIGLLALLAVFETLAIGGALIQPVAGVLLEVSAAMLVFGAGVTLLGIGLTAIMAALTAFVALLMSLGAAAGVIGKGIEALVEGIAKGIAKGLDALVRTLGGWLAGIIEYIAAHGGEIIDAFLQLLNLVADAVIAVIPFILYTVFGTLAESLKSLIDSEVLKDICNSILLLVEQALDLLIDHAPTLIDKLLNLVYVLLDKLGEHIGQILDHTLTFIENFLNGLATQIVEHSGPLLNACENIIMGIVYFLLSLLQEVLKLIPGVGEEMAAGLQGVKDEIANSMTDSEGKKLLDEFGNGMVESLEETKNRLWDELQFGFSMPDVLPEDWKAAQIRSISLFGTDAMAAYVMAMEAQGPEVQEECMKIINSPMPEMEKQKQLYYELGGNYIEYYSNGIGAHQKYVDKKHDEFIAAEKAWATEMGYIPKETTETALRETIETVDQLTPQMKGEIYTFFTSAFSDEQIQAQADEWRAAGDIGMAEYLESLRDPANLEEARRCAEELFYTGADAMHNPDVYEDYMKDNMDGANRGMTTAGDSFIRVNKNIAAKGPLELVRQKNEYKSAGQTNIGEYSSGLNSSASLRDISNAIADAITKALKKILDHSRDFNSRGASNSEEYAKGLASKSRDVENAGANLSKSGAEGANSHNNQYKTSGQAGGKQYSSGIDGMKSVIKGSGSVIAKAGVEGSGSRNSEFRSKGHDAADGFGAGMDDRHSTIYNKAWALAGMAMAGLKDKLRSSSPSKETMKIGNYAGDGFAIGIEQYGTTVKRVSEDLAEESLTGLQNGMKEVAKVVDMMDMDYAPTIRPVIDLSSVTDGITAMDTMFDESHAIAAQASFDMYNAYSKPDYIQQFAKMAADNESKMAKIIDKQTEVLLDIRTRLAHQQIVLDSGELVGATINKIDDALGERMYRAERGN